MAAKSPANDTAARWSASLYRMVSSDTGERVTSGRWRLTIFVATVVLVPALISHLIPVRRDFDPKPIARLRQQRLP